MLKKEILSLIEARIDISRVNLKYFTQRLGDFATTVYVFVSVHKTLVDEMARPPVQARLCIPSNHERVVLG